MVKLTVLHYPPTDVDAFNEHYINVHVPLSRAVPGVIRSEITMIDATLQGEASPYHLIYEIFYESREAMMAGLSSPEGQAVAADGANLPTSQPPLLLVGEVVD